VQEPGTVAGNMPMLQNQVGGGSGMIGRRVAPQAAPMAAQDRDFAAAKMSSSQRESRSLAVMDSAMASSVGTVGSRRIGARFFTLRDGVWTDARIDAPSASGIRRIRVKPYSDAYFALIRAIPELGEPLGLGDRVVVFGRAVAIELAADGNERLSDGQVAAVSADW
jgi:hypothetical protein